MELQEFCTRVAGLMDDHRIEDVPSQVAEILPELLGNGDLLRPEHRTAPGEDYARHDVFLCPKDRFSVLAVVWPAGISSPIHDHKTWCAFGVYDGVIEETTYRSANADAAPVAVNTWTAGDVAHLPVGSGDIHRMHNPSDRAAISIHVYGGNADKIGANVQRVYRETASTVA